jgi:hypothetical protein
VSYKYIGGNPLRLAAELRIFHSQARGRYGRFAEIQAVAGDEWKQSTARLSARTGRDTKQ